MLEALLSLPRPLKKIIFVIHDLAVIFTAFWFTQSLKANYDAEWNNPANWLAFIATAVITIFVFVRLGLYRAVTRFVSTKVLTTALLGSTVSAGAFFLSILVFEQRLRLALPVAYFLCTVVLIAGSRLLLRTLLSGGVKDNMTPVLIYGAGQSGRQLLEAIKQVHEYRAIAFIDDNPSLHHAVIYDLTVYTPSEIGRLIKHYGIKKILLAIPSASDAERKTILQRLEPYPCEVLTIPGMKDLVDGKISVSALKKVSVMDLLGRSPVAPDPALMQADISGKTVMVTGAGGSIGSELCRQILNYRPKQLILFELSEFSLYSIHQELQATAQKNAIGTKLLPMLGSVQDADRLRNIMQAFEVNTVYHAAAYKHVPMVEYNTIEGIRNNIFGTLHCAQAAVDAKVETFVLISTDKAVRPTNTMGASKRMAELILQALADTHTQTRFCMVRFGNVLGSSGSVVPVFEKQIAQGGPVTLTHPEITRYFMTIPEAAQLVIQAGAMGKGGDVFVLDMGEAVKIIDLAKQMIRLSGLSVKDDANPQGDIEILISGLRPGEKLYEELLIGEEVENTTHPRIMTANEVKLSWTDLSDILSKLDLACRQADQEAIRALLLAAPTGFAPTDNICDLAWQQTRQQV